MQQGVVRQNCRELPNLNALFAPTSVAVIGASADPDRIGGRPIHYAIAASFQGRIYPVNPNRTEIQGLKAYPDVRALPENIDLVVIAVPSDSVSSSIEAAAYLRWVAPLVVRRRQNLTRPRSLSTTRF